MTDTTADLRIDAALARRLVADQFPDWAGLEVTPMRPQGHDNRSFRLGSDMVVRLPAAARYAAQVGKEQRWLPALAPGLPLPIPAPLAEGRPSDAYPFPWSIYRWLPGETASLANVTALTRLATDLAGFLRALQALPVSGAPTPGAHNFHRGGDLAAYDAETRDSAAALAGEFVEGSILDCWADARASSWQHAPVWVHGDVAVGNLLVRDGALSGVIDFGSSAAGDPACDLVIAWTLFAGESRAAFRLALPYDAETWSRARGWALWKALLTIRQAGPEADAHRKVVAAILADRQNKRAGSG
jgi:aminoglycoside phosphotransferase (APT) family kinase protein